MFFLLFLFIQTISGKLGPSEWRAGLTIISAVELFVELMIFACWLNGIA